MFEGLLAIISFATVVVSLAYGTTVAWHCGQRCNANTEPQSRYKSLLVSIPGATLLYFFGLLILFSYLLDSYLARSVVAFTTSIFCTAVVISTAMPELKRKPMSRPLIHAELTDGSICHLAQRALNILLEQNRIIRFKRAEGWVLVGKDPLRDMLKSQSYSDSERRQAT